jgi:hypothetical protein
VLKRRFASPVLHRCNVNAQICVTRPQCVKQLKSISRLVQKFVCTYTNEGVEKQVNIALNDTGFSRSACTIASMFSSRIERSNLRKAKYDTGVNEAPTINM